MEDSKFGDPDYIDAFSERFDNGVKKTFSVLNSHEDQFVKIGNARSNDLSHNISRGLLKLTG